VRNWLAASNQRLRREVESPMTDTSGGRKLHKARKTPAVVYSSSLPALPATIEISYHAMDRTKLEEFEQSRKESIVTSQTLYKPGILASARINFSGTRWNLRYEKDITKVILFPSKHQPSKWEENLNPEWEYHDSRQDPESTSLFFLDGSYDFSSENFESLQEDFIQYLVSSEILKVEYHPTFKLDRKLDETEESFLNRCMEQARENYNREMHRLEETLQRHQDRLKQKLEKEVRGMEDDLENSRTRELDVQDEIEAHDSKTTIEDIKKEMAGFHELKEAKMKEFQENLTVIAKERESENFRLNQSHIHLLRFGLIWLPYVEFVIQEEDSRRLELVQAF
jgi:hypothetical protein